MPKKSTKLPKRFQPRANRIRAKLKQLSDELEASYSAEERMSHHPHVHSPAAREALREYQDRYLPLPPDGKTQHEREDEAYRAKELARAKPVAVKPITLTASRRQILEWLASGVKPEWSFLGVGRDVEKLKRAGLIKSVAHPTARQGRFPADALELTDAGHARLAKKPIKPR